MSFKEAISSLVNGKQTDELYNLISENHLSKASGTEIEDVLITLTTAELNVLWNSLELICESTVLTQFGDSAVPAQKEKGSLLLFNIVTIALKTTIPELHDVPGGLLQTALVLTGLLMEDLPSKCSKLKNKIALLGETWWQLKKEGYEALGGQTLLFYIKKLVSEPLIKSDVKRLWNLHEALHIVKLDNALSSELQKYLKMCVVSPVFMDVDMGQKFISCCLLLNEDIIEELHLAIKKNLPNWSKKEAKVFAEIYHRAWKAAPEPLQKKLEFWCIQDMMQMAMLVDRTSGHFALLKIFLHYIHMQRTDGTTDMLVRLYEPILWRHLKVPNADVRANAAAIFFSAFPLEVKREIDNTDLLQKQYSVMQDLIWDNNPCVRAIAITGICDACTDYWEMMPISTIQSLLKICVDDMIHDTTSCDVRAAVSLGFAHLLDNPLAHKYLKTLLPKLRISFHDNSEQVRVAVLELLVKCKGINPFVYSDVVPLQDLLTRLKTDAQPVKKRIMKLIINSIFPENAPKMELLNRCIQLVSMDRRVSLSFYGQLGNFREAKDIVHFLRFICRYLKRLLKCRKETKENSVCCSAINQANQTREEADDSDSGKNTEDDTTMQNYELLENPEWIGGLIDIVSVLWPKILKQKLVVAGDECYQKMKAAMFGLLPLLITFYKDSSAWDSVLYFASYVSPKSGSGHMLEKYCLSRLRGLPATAQVQDYSTLLSCLFQWSYDDEVMELLSGWLNKALNVNSRSKQQAARRVRFRDPCDVQPGLACDILNWLLGDPFCRTKLCATQVHLQSCWTQLQCVMKVIERRLKEGRVPDPALTTDDFLVNAFSLYCRITIHLSKTSDYDPLTVYEDIFKWAESELLPCLQQSMENSCNASTRASIRLARRNHSNVAISLLEVIFKVCNDMLLIGIANVGFCSQMKLFINATLLAASDVNLTNAAGRLMYHLLNFSRTHELNEIATYKSLTSELFDSILRSTAVVLATCTESLPEKFKDLKRIFIELLIYSHGESLASEETVERVASIGSALVANINDMIEKECGYTPVDNLSDLPLLTQLLLSVLFTKASMVCSLLNHLQCLLSSDLITTPSKVLAVVAILHIVGKNYGRAITNSLRTAVLAAVPVVQNSQSRFPANSNDSSLAIERDYISTAEQLIEELGDKIT